MAEEKEQKEREEEVDAPVPSEGRDDEANKEGKDDAQVDTPDSQNEGGGSDDGPDPNENEAVLPGAEKSDAVGAETGDAAEYPPKDAEDAAAVPEENGDAAGAVGDDDDAKERSSEVKDGWDEDHPRENEGDDARGEEVPGSAGGADGEADPRGDENARDGSTGADEEESAQERNAAAGPAGESAADGSDGAVVAQNNTAAASGNAPRDDGSGEEAGERTEPAAADGRADGSDREGAAGEHAEDVTPRTARDFESDVPSLAELGVVDNSIAEVDAAVARLQAEGRFTEALRYMEAGLVARRDVFGVGSVELTKACEVFVVSSNMLAVEHMGISSDQVAYSTLKKCEAVLDPEGYLRDRQALRLKLQAITSNNLGAYFSGRGKLHAALHYLQAALRIETTIGDADSPACTHLNLCSLLSRLGRHEEAIDHVQCSLELLTNEIARSGGPAPRAGAAGGAGGGNADSARGADQANAWCLYPVALFNLGVEQEFLGSESALETYIKACREAEDRLGETHPVTQKIRLAYAQADDAQRRILRDFART